MTNYKIYSFTNSRHLESNGKLTKGQLQLANNPISFSSLKNSIPLFEYNRMYWCTKDSYIQCTEIPSSKTVWSNKYLPSPEGQEYNFTATLLALNNDILITACYPYLYGIDKNSGEASWKIKYPYSTTPSQILISNDYLLAYALTTKLERFFIIVDLSDFEITGKLETDKIRPDFLLSRNKLDEFVLGHRHKSLAAILEKYNTINLKKIWKQDYTRESLVTSGNNKPEKACWQGKYMLYNNQIIVPTDGKKLLSLSYTDGKKMWEFHLNQNHSHTNGFDIKDETLYLVDDAEYIRLDVESGEVIDRRDNEKEWEKAGLLYSTSNLCINGEVAAMGSIYNKCYVLIDLKTGIPFWTHKTRFQFDKFTPVLLDNILFVYSTMDGRIEIFAIE